MAEGTRAPCRGTNSHLCKTGFVTSFVTILHACTSKNVNPSLIQRCFCDHCCAVGSTKQLTNVKSMQVFQPQVALKSVCTLTSTVRLEACAHVTGNANMAISTNWLFLCVIPRICPCNAASRTMRSPSGLTGRFITISSISYTKTPKKGVQALFCWSLITSAGFNEPGIVASNTRPLSCGQQGILQRCPN